MSHSSGRWVSSPLCPGCAIVHVVSFLGRPRFGPVWTVWASLFTQEVRKDKESRLPAFGISFSSCLVGVPLNSAFKKGPLFARKLSPGVGRFQESGRHDNHFARFFWFPFKPNPKCPPCRCFEFVGIETRRLGI